MTIYSIDLLPEAEAEIEHALLWYLERNPKAADAFREEVFAAIDSLATTATMWPRDEDGFHRYILRHFPFTLYYEVIAHTVTLYAVAHQHRRLGYWQTKK